MLEIINNFSMLTTESQLSDHCGVIIYSRSQSAVYSTVEAEVVLTGLLVWTSEMNLALLVGIKL